jgi:hypothetical protein
MPNLDWQLMVNGLNLAGSVAGVGSLVSGFSLERRLRQIELSLKRLEEVLYELSKAPGIARAVLDMITSFLKAADPRQQIQSAARFEACAKELRRDLPEDTWTMLSDALTEMKMLIDSVQYSRTGLVNSPHNILRQLVANPRRAGVTEFWDISDGGLWTRKRPLLMGPEQTPVVWANPLTGQLFLGEMPLSRLREYGLEICAPEYQRAVDGHVYSHRYGLYLPVKLVALSD